MVAYKGIEYYQDNDSLWKVRRDDSIFIIALDDSKASGRRRIFMQNNTEKKCKEYIDWLLSRG
ncbi:MAG: hypothetical protein ABIF10_01725 [Candidatus Woesearchaeota archaeon]